MPPASRLELKCRATDCEIIMIIFCELEHNHMAHRTHVQLIQQRIVFLFIWQIDYKISEYQHRYIDYRGSAVKLNSIYKDVMRIWQITKRKI